MQIKAIVETAIYVDDLDETETFYRTVLGLPVIRTHFRKLIVRNSLAFCLLLAITLPCHAQADKVKPTTLPPKELADGWILLFDGETTFGWNVVLPSGGKLPKVLDGALDLSPLGDNAIRTNIVASFFELQFEYVGAGAYVDFLASEKRPEETLLTARSLKAQKDWTPYTVHVADGRVSFDGRIEKSLIPASRCFIGFEGGGQLMLRNIKLRPLNTKSLFNGTDLTGWREFPGKKSKFTVTDKGAINVKDGPGDLQTIGKYQDFILQLECNSNGKHLNSGVFFRCRDNEYQNGYEAQIFNKFSPDPTQKYLVEEYDPK